MEFGKNNASLRDIWLKKQLQSLTPNARILDAGAGELRYKKYCTHLDYVSQDFGQYDGKGDDIGLQTGDWDNSKLDIVSDICEVPEQDCSFDAILCSEVFEHIPNPISAIKEFERLLKPDGILILTAPFCSLTHFAPFHFYSGFNSYFYKEHLGNNFNIQEITPSGNYFEYIAQELHRMKLVTNTYTTTRLRFYERLLIRIIPLILKRLARHDNNSSSLLNFGFLIVAKKK